MSFPLYTVILIVLAVVFIVMAVVTGSRRMIAGSKPFALLMLSTAFWVFGRAMEGAAVDMNVKIIWAKFEYIGIPWAPVLWLILSLSFTRQEKWLTRRNLMIVSVIPAISMLLAFTNELHGLIWTSIERSHDAGDILVYNHGIWFWILIVHSYLAVLIGALWMFQAVIRYPNLYRRQALALFVGAIIPIFGNAIYMAGVSPIHGLDLTPFGFAFSGIIYAWTVFRFQLFQLVPVARESLVENMVDGVIVLDDMGRVVDINPAAHQLLMMDEGLPVEAFHKFFEPYQKISDLQTEIQWGSTPLHYLEMRITPLYHQNNINGRLVVLHDVTQRKRMEDGIRKIAEEAGTMAERQRLGRDLHDLVTQNMYSLMLFADSGRDYAHARKWKQVMGCLEDINQIAAQVLKELRLLLFELRPTTFEHVGIVEALRERLEAVEQRARIKTTLEADDDLQIPDEYQGALYRIAVEALNNSLKYARASSVVARIMTKDNRIVLEVEDDGTGFEQDTAEQSRGGMGLSNMREHAERLKGMLEIISTHDQGTLVRVKLPVLTV